MIHNHAPALDRPAVASALLVWFALVIYAAWRSR